MATTEWLRLWHVWIIGRTIRTLTKQRYETWWQWPWLQRNNSYASQNQIVESQQQDHAFLFIISAQHFYAHAITRFSFHSFHTLLLHHRHQKLKLKLLNLVSIWVLSYFPKERYSLLSSKFYLLVFKLWCLSGSFKVVFFIMDSSG